MICAYPHIKGISGYRRGCRCGRCSQAQRKRNLAYKETATANRCFEGCMSQSSIEQWAASVVATMLPSERRMLAELDI